MKKLIVYLTLIMALLATTSTAQAYTFETYPLEGNVGKYKIVISLTFDSQNNTVKGWYYYKSKGSKNKINLTGTYRGDGQDGTLNLTEKVNGKETGYFSGEYGFGNRVTHVTGTWKSPAGKKLEWYADNM